MRHRVDLLCEEEEEKSKDQGLRLVSADHRSDIRALMVLDGWGVVKAAGAMG